MALLPQANEPSTQLYVEKVDKLIKKVQAPVTSLAGFGFSGDFRLRADGTFRPGNTIAGPYQTGTREPKQRAEAISFVSPGAKAFQCPRGHRRSLGQA